MYFYSFMEHLTWLFEGLYPPQNACVTLKSTHINLYRITSNQIKHNKNRGRWIQLWKKKKNIIKKKNMKEFK